MGTPAALWTLQYLVHTHHGKSKEPAGGASSSSSVAALIPGSSILSLGIDVARQEEAACGARAGFEPMGAPAAGRALQHMESSLTRS